jgi:hypothetical protein
VLTLKRRPVEKTRAESTPKPPAPERRLETARPSEDEVRPLAYKRWQEAGCPASDGVEFWLEAEAEILRGRRR